VVDHSSDDGVVWLYDPELDADLYGPVARRPTEVYAELDEIIAEAGIDEVVVTGAVQGLRRRARWWGFDLVEMSCSLGRCRRSRPTWRQPARPSPTVRWPP
jgi:nucleotide-binding universal stress UspA family protein